MEPAPHTTVLVDGQVIHWSELGPADDPVPLVLLHGLMDSHLSWKAAAPLLAKTRRVLMPDLLGCGLSARPNASYALDWHADMMGRWLDTLAFKQVDIVGHSFGGGIAQVMLLQRPERIRRLVLVASGGLGREVGFWLRLGSFPFFVERFGQPFMAFGTRRAVGGKRTTSSRADVLALAAMNAKRGTARAFSRSVRDVINFRGQSQLFSQRSHLLKELPPIAVFWGENDNLIPAAHGRRLAEVADHVALTVFESCGHWLHQEQPERFAEATLGFLGDENARGVRLRQGARRLGR